MSGRVATAPPSHPPPDDDATASGRTTPSTAKLLRRLLSIARPHWPHLGAILALGVLATPIALLQPVALKLVVDHVVGTEPLPALLARLFGGAPAKVTLLWVAGGLALAVSVLSALRWTGQWLLQVYTGERLVLRMRALMFRHVQRMSLSHHDTEGSMDSIYRIQQDAAAIENILVYSVVPLVTAGFPLVGVTAVMVMLDWQLALIALGAAPLVVILVRAYSMRLRERWRLLKQLDSAALAVVQEVITALRVVKAFGREDSEVGRFETHARRKMAGHVSAVRTHSEFETLLALIIGAATATVLGVGGLHVLRGVISLGELVMIMSYVTQLLHPLERMSQSATGLASSLASAERAFSVLDSDPEVSERPHARRLERARGDVEWRGVAFTYPGGQRVLSGLDLVVPAGTRVGIQGRTGAGKSTLMSLLLRFYDPDSGAILLDGVDLRDYRLSDLREQFAIVLQDPVLLSTTIGENIAYGRPGASAADIEKAARLADAHDFIARQAEGYDSQVGERGGLLSGGERQRIALARAFLRDAPILILDEPTSAVDIHTERAIIEALQRLMEGRTTFVITHRMSALEGCDVVLHLEGGEVERVANPPLRALGMGGAAP